MHVSVGREVSADVREAAGSMGGLRLLAIMKTDIGSFRPQLRALAEQDLKALLVQH